MDFVTIKHFDNQMDAHFVQSILENEGIYSILVDKNMGSLYPGVIAIGGIRLQVDSKDLEQALAILEDVSSTPVIDDKDEAIKCPNCSSTDFYTGSKNTSGLQGVINTLIVLLRSVFPIFFKNVYKCKKCGTEFKNPSYN